MKLRESLDRFFGNDRFNELWLPAIVWVLVAGLFVIVANVIAAGIQ